MDEFAEESIFAEESERTLKIFHPGKCSSPVPGNAFCVSPRVPTALGKIEGESVIDSFTFQPIPVENLVTVIVIGETTQTFDIDTLYRHWIESGEEQPVNPLSRNPLSLRVIERIRDYKKSLEERRISL